MRKDAGLGLRVAGALVLRYGLVLVIGWIGLICKRAWRAQSNIQ
jgi:hypothetical protein